MNQNIGQYIWLRDGIVVKPPDDPQDLLPQISTTQQPSLSDNYPSLNYDYFQWLTVQREDLQIEINEPPEQISQIVPCRWNEESPIHSILFEINELSESQQIIPQKVDDQINWIKQSDLQTDIKIRLTKMQEQLDLPMQSAGGKHNNTNKDFFSQMFVEKSQLKAKVTQSITQDYKNLHRVPNFSKPNNELFTRVLIELYQRGECAMTMLMDSSEKLFTPEKTTNWGDAKTNYYKRMLWEKIKLANVIRTTGWSIEELIECGYVRVNKRHR